MLVFHRVKLVLFNTKYSLESLLFARCLSRLKSEKFFGLQVFQAMKLCYPKLMEDIFGFCFVSFCSVLIFLCVCGQRQIAKKSFMFRCLHTFNLKTLQEKPASLMNLL